MIKEKSTPSIGGGGGGGGEIKTMIIVQKRQSDNGNEMNSGQFVLP